MPHCRQNRRRRPSCERQRPPRRYTPAVSSAADALAYLRRRERLLARIQRVNDAISHYDEWEANRHLPPDCRRVLPTPPVSREGLTGLHRMLVEELARLEGLEGRAGLPPSSPPPQP